MSKYFKDLWTGVSSVTIGLGITFRHLFTRSITIQYPHETLEMNERTRARLVNVADDCEVCFSCDRACPVGCFTINGLRAGKDEDLGMLPTGKPKKMHLLQFDIDFTKCLYCGLCVEVCDTKSLHWTGPQEDSVFLREEMVKSFATMPAEEVERRLREDADKKAARAQAAAEKKKAEAAAEAAPAKPKPAVPVKKAKAPASEDSPAEPKTEDGSEE